MNVREQVLAAVRQLAATKPADQITYADIAGIAGVHWTTVRRHIGGKAELRNLLAKEQPEPSGDRLDTRTKILKAAAIVFARFGYAGASLDQVAHQAGMTKGAVYWHFSSKSDLFLALMEKNLTESLSVLPDQAAEIFASLDSERALAEWLKGQLACVDLGPGQSMLFFEFVTSSRDAAVQAKFRALLRRSYAGTEQILLQLQEAGHITRDVSPFSISLMFHALIDGLLLAWVVDPEKVQLDSLTHEFAHLLWMGIRPTKS